MADELTLAKKPWESVRSYFEGVRIEMKKVTWPGKQEIYGTTIMVILTTFLFSAYFWVCDAVSSHLISWLLKVFLHRA
jgi:preprotein translocase subunit SecE